MTPEEQGRYFTLRVGGSSSQARLEGTRLYSSTVDVVGVEGGDIRGAAWGHIVDLHTTEDGAKGVIASRETELHVTRSADKVHVTGVFVGAASDITIDATSVYGQLGHCGYELRASTTDPGWYEGHRSCDNLDRETTFAPPKAFGSLPVSEQGVYLLIALAR